MSFQKVAALAELRVGTAAAVELEGHPVCLVRVDEQSVKAIYNVCSHEEYELSEGWVDGNTIECSLHGSTFNLDTGKPETLPAVKPVPIYACRVAGDAIEVDPAQQLNDAPIPRH